MEDFNGSGDGTCTRLVVGHEPTLVLPPVTPLQVGTLV